MEVTFSINLDLSKNKRDEKSKNNCITKSSNCGCGESNLEKCLDVPQKVIKMIKVK